MAGICFFYIFAALLETGRFDWRSAKTDQYNLLTQALLAGSTALPVAPRPELLALPNPYDPIANAPYRMHDTALYQGHYYSVYGPTAAVTAFGPYRLLTGYDLPDNAAACLYAIAGFLFSAGLFLSFQARAFPRGQEGETPLWLNKLCILSLGICQFVPALVRRPRFYEIAILSGYCFAMAGFFFLFQATQGEKSDKSFESYMALLAGFAFAFLVGCRPVFAPVPILVLAFYAACRFPLERWEMLKRRNFYLLSLPIMAGYLSMGWYNYARFGNPFETGHRYALTSIVHMVARPQLVNLSPSLYLLFFCPFQMDRVFPFLHFAAPELKGLPDSYFREYVVGAFVATPFLFASIFACISKAMRTPFRLFEMLLLLSAGSVALLIASVGWVTQRYVVDFVPEVLLVASWAAIRLWRTAFLEGRHRQIAFVLSSAIGYSLIVHTAMDIGGSYDNLMQEHLGAYRRLGDRLTDLAYGRKSSSGIPPDGQAAADALTPNGKSNDYWTLGILDNPSEGNANRRVVRFKDTEATHGLKVGDVLRFRSSGTRRITATSVDEGFKVVQLDGLVSPAMDGWPRTVAIEHR